MASEYKVVELWGGACTSKLPSTFRDASFIREVPDHQEVYVDMQRDHSVVMEVVEYKQNVSNEEAGRFFFVDLVTVDGECRGAIGSTEVKTKDCSVRTDSAQTDSARTDSAQTESPDGGMAFWTSLGPYRGEVSVIQVTGTLWREGRCGRRLGGEKENTGGGVGESAAEGDGEERYTVPMWLCIYRLPGVLSEILISYYGERMYSNVPVQQSGNEERSDLLTAEHSFNTLISNFTIVDWNLFE